MVSFFIATILIVIIDDFLFHKSDKCFQATEWYTKLQHKVHTHISKLI